MGKKTCPSLLYVFQFCLCSVPFRGMTDREECLPDPSSSSDLLASMTRRLATVERQLKKTQQELVDKVSVKL